MVFDGCAPLVWRWNGYVPSSKSKAWCLFVDLVLQEKAAISQFIESLYEYFCPQDRIKHWYPPQESTRKSMFVIKLSLTFCSSRPPHPGMSENSHIPWFPGIQASNFPSHGSFKFPFPFPGKGNFGRELGRDQSTAHKWLKRDKY